jgi:replicative DNA helicase
LIEEIIKFLDEHKLSYKPVNDSDNNIQVNCPLCTDTRKRLGISITKKNENPWKCFNCQARGRSLNTLKNAMGVLKSLDRKSFVENKSKNTYAEININEVNKMHELLLEESKIEYLKYVTEERGISVEAVKHFKLGFRSKFTNEKGSYNAGPHLSIVGFEESKPVYLKYRSLDPDIDKSKKWRRHKNCKTILFNNDVLNDYDYNEIYITEAELDCITLWDKGVRNVIGLTAGADTFENMQEWYDRLERFKKIYLVLDSDSAGQEGALKIARRLGMWRCHNIVLPEGYKDPNDYFKEHTLKDFEQLVASAKQFNPENVKNLLQLSNEYIESLTIDKVKNAGYTTGIGLLDKVIGSLQLGTLNIIAGRPKTGKTIFAMNILNRMANIHNITTFNYQCEMSTEDMVQIYTNMATKFESIKSLPFVDRDIDGSPVFKSVKQKEEYEEIKESNLDIIRSARIKIPMRRLISYHPESRSELELEKVCDKIREVVRRFNCKVVLFDNLHFLCRGKDSKEKVDEATQAFKMLSRELNIIFFIVVHPKKTNHNNELDNDDLKESGSIFQDADTVTLLHRAVMDEDDMNNTSKDMLDSMMHIKVTARRSPGGRTKVIFNGEKCLVVDDPREILKLELERLGSANRQKQKNKEEE